MGFWQEKLKIKDLSFPRFISGPLDGITDSPFRQVVREFSPNNLIYSEMRHVACLANEACRAKALRFEQCERPLNFQITANSTKDIELVIEKILASGVDMIDLNIGCPAKNVVKNLSGSALMADMVTLENVLILIRKLLPIPFTVKMRAGFKKRNALEVARLVEECGADAIAIHPRLQSSSFSGELDFDLVAKIKESLKIPVLFSGGIVDFSTAHSTYEKTGVDGFLIGRAICGKPWKLKELEEKSLSQSFSLNTKQKLEYGLRHLEIGMQHYGTDSKVGAFMGILAPYLSEFPNASAMRRSLGTCDSVENLKKFLKEIIDGISE